MIGPRGRAGIPGTNVRTYLLHVAFSLIKCVKKQPVSCFIQCCCSFRAAWGEVAVLHQLWLRSATYISSSTPELSMLVFFCKYNVVGTSLTDQYHNNGSRYMSTMEEADDVMLRVECPATHGEEPLSLIV